MWKKETVEAPAIIDEETWNNVQKALETRRNYSDRKNQHQYLLKGLLRCGCCGENLYGRKKADENYYMCSSKRKKSCGLRSPNIDRLNGLIWDQVINSDVHLEYLMKNQATLVEIDKGRQVETLATLKRTVTNIQQKKSRLMELYELNRIDLATFDKRQQEHEDQLSDVKLQIEKIEYAGKFLAQDDQVCKNHTEAVLVLRQKMAALTFTEKQYEVRKLVEKIIVRWDGERVEHLVETTFRIGNVRYLACSAITPAHLPSPSSLQKLWALVLQKQKKQVLKPKPKKRQHPLPMRRPCPSLNLKQMQKQAKRTTSP
jgi:site-specific DNA recombinase